MDENLPQTKTPLRRPVMQYAEQKEERKERIKIWMAAALVTVAGFIDLVEAILDLLGIGEIVSPVISVCADLIFWIWFKMLGVNFTKNPKNLASMGGQALIGVIPGADILPELTIGVLAIVLMTRAEDKGGILGKVAQMAQGKINS